MYFVIENLFKEQYQWLRFQLAFLSLTDFRSMEATERLNVDDLFAVDTAAKEIVR